MLSTKLGAAVSLADDGALVSRQGRALNIPAITVADAQPASGPIIVAHRGGPHVEPEHTLEAYKAAYASGVRYIEMDVWRLADGGLGVMHDATVDRTTDGTGEVVNMTTAQWAALRVDALAANSTGYALEPPPFFAQVLDWAADRDVVLVAEPKHGAAVAPMLRDLEARGFAKDKFIFAGFDAGVLVLPMQLGWTCVLTAADATTALIQAAFDAGFRHYASALTGWSNAEVSFAKSLGMKTWAYTIDRRVELDAAAALGIDYVWSDDPVYVSRARPPMQQALLTAGRFMPGTLGSSAADGISARGTLGSDGLRFGNVTGTFYQGVMWGSICPIGGAAGLPAVYAIEAEFTINALFGGAGSSRWAGFMFNAATDRQFGDVAGSSACHQLLMRGSGSLELFSKLDGVAGVLGAQFVGTPLVLGTKYKVTISVDAAGVAVALSNGAALQFADTRFRGGYCQLGTNGADVTWHTCRVLV